MNKRRGTFLHIRIGDDEMRMLSYVADRNECTKSEIIRSWIKEKYIEETQYAGLFPCSNLDDTYDEEWILD